MMKHKIKFSVHVPGTSANLGPGFDIMGLALNIYNEFIFKISDSPQFNTTMQDGTDLPFLNEDNLVIWAYKKYFDLYLPEEKIPGFDLIMNLSLPLKGGLGSSASALVAGMEAARYLHGRNFTNIPQPSLNEILYQLALMEGHPDNTTPALIGGLTISYFNESNSLEFYKYRFPSSISLYAIVPDIQMGTMESRAELPDEYPIADVVFNMARIAAWFEFIRTGKPGHLEHALEDRIHTPFRIKKGSVLSEIVSLLDNHVTGISLSGSGPTLLLYIQKKRALQLERKLSELILNKMRDLELNYRFFKVKPDNQGCRIKTYS